MDTDLKIRMTELILNHPKFNYSRDTDNCTPRILNSAVKILNRKKQKLIALAHQQRGNLFHRIPSDIIKKIGIYTALAPSYEF